MDARVLTNDTFAKSTAYLQRLAGPAPNGAGSLERFARASRLAVRPPAGALDDGAFRIPRLGEQPRQPVAHRLRPDAAARFIPNPASALLSRPIDKLGVRNQIVVGALRGPA